MTRKPPRRRGFPLSLGRERGQGVRAVTKSWRDGLLLPITNVADAAPFVERLGFCTWAPVSGVGFPNLAEAMGESAWSVMEQTWFWKDDVHLEKRLYYGKIVRGQ